MEGHFQKGEKATMEWEKICANYVFDKEFVSRIYKELLQLDNKKTNKKWVLHLNSLFLHERYRNGQ